MRVSALSIRPARRSTLLTGLRLVAVALWLTATAGSARASMCGSLPETVSHGCDRCDERRIESSAPIASDEAALPACHRGAAKPDSDTQSDSTAPCCAAGVPSLCAPLPASATAPSPADAGVTIVPSNAPLIVAPALAPHPSIALISLRSNAPPGAIASTILRL